MLGIFPKTSKNWFQSSRVGYTIGTVRFSHFWSRGWSGDHTFSYRPSVVHELLLWHPILWQALQRPFSTRSTLYEALIQPKCLHKRWDVRVSHTTIIYHIDVHDLFMILICFQGFSEDFVTTTPIVILEFRSMALCRHQLPEACWLTTLASGEKWGSGLQREQLWRWFSSHQYGRKKRGDGVRIIKACTHQSLPLCWGYGLDVPSCRPIS